MEQKRCYGCMRIKGPGQICPHCGFDERTPNAPHQLPLGTVLRGQYLVGRVLGQGGFGITYLGWDRYLDIPVAIKEYYPTGTVMRKSLRDPSVTLCSGAEGELFRSTRDRFMREAKTLAKYSHVPEIVQVKNFFPENNTAYIVMEYVQGITLKDYVRRRGGRLNFREALAIVRPIVVALSSIHRDSLIHRDISPDNIMMLQGGGAKLLDFGSIRDVGRAMMDKSLSRSTDAILKQGFAPVEQYQQKGAMGPWTDVYALCATLYYCVTGRIPPDSPARMLGEEALNFDWAPELTQQQRQVLSKGMAVKAAERYLSMEQLHQALFQAPIPSGNSGSYTAAKPQESESTVAMVSPPENTVAVMGNDRGAEVEPPRRKPWTAVLAILLIAALGVGAWYYLKTDETSLADRDVTIPAFDPPVWAPIEPDETVNSTEPARLPETQEERPVIQNPEENTMRPHYENGKEVTPQSPAFGTAVTREQVKTITVLYLTKDAPEDAVDISQNQNGKVLAWAKENGEFYDLYLAAEGGIYAPADSRYLFGQFTNLHKINFNGAFFSDSIENASAMFYEDKALVELDTSGFNTTNVTDMSFMFAGCSMLEKLDVSGFDTAKVTNMKTMFLRCESLRTLDVSGFDTANVTDMEYMFSGVKYVPVLDVSGFDTAKVTNMQCMFNECGAVEVLDVSGFHTGQVTNLRSMFSGCAAVRELDVSGFDTTKVNNMGSMFSGCGALEILNISSKINTIRTTDMSFMFFGCGSLQELDVSGFDTANVITMESMFDGCERVKKLDVSGFDTKNVTDMSFMFSTCRELEKLNVSKFKTEKVTDMECMFQSCGSLTSLAVDNFNTRKVTNMNRMFLNCAKLQSLNVSRFRTGKVEDMQYMFSGCTGLTGLDVSGFSTGKVKNMACMFENCSGLTYLKLNHFDTARVETMKGMFRGCSSLNYLDLKSFDTGLVTDMEGMFCECRALKSLDISNFNTGKVKNMAKMFYGCDSLKSLTLGTFNTDSVTEWTDFMEPGKKVKGKDWKELFT